MENFSSSISHLYVLPLLVIPPCSHPPGAGPLHGPGLPRHQDRHAPQYRQLAGGQA